MKGLARHNRPVRHYCGRSGKRCKGGCHPPWAATVRRCSTPTARATALRPRHICGANLPPGGAIATAPATRAREHVGVGRFDSSSRRAILAEILGKGAFIIHFEPSPGPREGRFLLCAGPQGVLARPLLPAPTNLDTAVPEGATHLDKRASST